MAPICLGQCSCSLLASPPHWHVPPSSPPASSQAQHHPLLFSPDAIVCGRGDLITEQVIIPNSMSELLSLRKLLAGPHSQGISPSRDIRPCACRVHEAPHCVHSRHSFPFLPFWASPSLLQSSLRNGPDSCSLMIMLSRSAPSWSQPPKQNTLGVSLSYKKAHHGIFPDKSLSHI